MSSDAGISSRNTTVNSLPTSSKYTSEIDGSDASRESILTLFSINSIASFARAMASGLPSSSRAPASATESAAAAKSEWALFPRPISMISRPNPRNIGINIRPSTRMYPSWSGKIRRINIPLSTIRSKLPIYCKFRISSNKLKVFFVN